MKAVLSIWAMTEQAEASPLEQAKDKALNVAGGPTKLSAKLAERDVTITPQAISQWKSIPAERCLVIEEITGVSRYEQRPDVFGPAPCETSPSIAPESSAETETESSSS